MDSNLILSSTSAQSSQRSLNTQQSVVCNDNINQNQQCNICYENFNLQSNVPREICKHRHVMCEICLRRILKNEIPKNHKLPRCPICRSKLGNGKFQFPVSSENMARLQVKQFLKGLDSKQRKKYEQYIQLEESSHNVDVAGCPKELEHKGDQTAVLLTNFMEIWGKKGLNQQYLEVIYYMYQEPSNDAPQLFKNQLRYLNVSFESTAEVLIEMYKPIYGLQKQVQILLKKAYESGSRKEKAYILRKCQHAGVQLVTFIVSLNISSDQYQEIALEVLGKFTYTNLKDFEELGAFSFAIEYIITLLKNENTSELIACTALKVLGVLAFRSPKFRPVMVRQNVMDVILPPLQNSNLNKKNQAVKAFWCMIDSNLKIQKTVVGQEVIEPIINCLVSSDAQVRNIAKMITYQLTRNGIVIEGQFDHQLVNMLIDKLQHANFQSENLVQYLTHLQDLLVKNPQNIKQVLSKNGIQLIQQIYINTKTERSKVLAGQILKQLDDNFQFDKEISVRSCQSDQPIRCNSWKFKTLNLFCPRVDRIKL